MSISSTTDLAIYVEEELGHTVHPSSDRTRIVDLMDRCHKTICGGGGELNLDKNGRPNPSPIIFPWALSQNPIVLNTSAIYNTGTCTANLGSTTVTLSDVSATNLSNYHLKVSTDSEIYRVSAHTAGTDSLTLDGAYVSANTTAAEYTAFKTLYTFAPSSGSILIPVSPIRIYDDNGEDYTIDLVDTQTLLKSFPMSEIEEDMPVMAGIRYQSASNLVVQMSHYTENVERMELDYIPIPTTLADNTAIEVDPVIPERHRIIIAHWAAYYLLRTNDDNRSQLHLAEAQSIFKTLVAERDQVMQRQDEDLGYIRPRPGQRGSFGRKIGEPVDSN